MNRAARRWARVYEAAKFLTGVRQSGTALERGVRVVSMTGGTPGQWATLLAALERAECRAADAEVRALFLDDGRPRPRAAQELAARGWPPLPDGRVGRTVRRGPRPRVFLDDDD